MSTYLKEWFLKEDDAKEFAKKMNGKVYNAEFIGGYHVMYQSPEKELMVAIESTEDYTDTEFHKNLVDIHIQNKDGSYGKVVDFYRLVCINENGLLSPFNKEIYTSAEATKEAAEKHGDLVLVNYDDLVHEAMKTKTKKGLRLDQRIDAAKGSLELDVHKENKPTLMEMVDAAKGVVEKSNKKDFEKKTMEDLTR